VDATQHPNDAHPAPHGRRPRVAAEASAEMQAQIDRLETIYERAPIGIGLVDFEGRTTMTNEVLRELLGFTPEEFASIPFSEFTHPDDVARNLELFDRMAAGEIEHFDMVKRFIRKDGRTLWADLTVSLVRDAAGRPEYAIGMTQDITQRKRLESELRAAEERYRLLVERVPAVVYVAEPGTLGRWSYVSPQIEHMLGFTAQEWVADPALWSRRIHPDDRRATLADKKVMMRLGAEGRATSDTYRLRHRDGRTVWVRDDAMVLRDSDGHAMFHGVLVDVTQEKQLEERLGHQAFHDPLTGLPNRKLFQDRVRRALARSQRHDDGVAVMFIDLDNFKTVNDTFGHASGDEVIIEAGRRLQLCARASDTAARLGGDEFALLVEGVDAAGVVALADRILAALHSEPVDVDGRSVTLGASIGIAVAGPAESDEVLLRNADLAMYQAKHRGRGRSVCYDPDMHATVVARFRLESRLQAAVAAGAVTVAYQPIADLRTGVVVGLEALARWHDAELGSVPPARFIPVAEQTGLIHELGRQIVDRACGDLARWRAATGSDAYVSVNVSPVQLDCADFHQAVAQVLADHGLEPSALVVEVTEGILLVERTRETLRDLRAFGVRVAIDDFGTGFSSLGYLRQLPVDMVKIDQSFLQPVEDGLDAPEFLSAIVRLAETLHVATIGEGVETRAQLAELQAAECAYGQGYLLARPGPIDAVPSVVRVVAEERRIDRRSA